jgi:hypothetical protein
MHSKFETKFNAYPMLQLKFELNLIKIAQEYTLGVLRCLDYLPILYSFQRILRKHFMQFY